MTGNQDCFSSLIAELPDEGTHLRNSDRVKAIDRFVQDQKLRVVHDGKRNRQPLLHTKRILREKLFILVRQSHQVQCALDGMAVWYAP